MLQCVFTAVQWLITDCPVFHQVPITQLGSLARSSQHRVVSVRFSPSGRVLAVQAADKVVDLFLYVLRSGCNVRQWQWQ